MRQIGITTTTRTVRMARGPAGALEPRGRWARSQGCGNRSAKLLHGLPEKISGVTIEEKRLVLGGYRLRDGVCERAHHMSTGIGDGITRADVTDRRRVACEVVNFPDGREAVGVNRRNNSPRQESGYEDSDLRGGCSSNYERIFMVGGISSVASELVGKSALGLCSA